MNDEKDRIYGKNLICLCIEDYENGDLNGTIWTPYEEEAISFKGFFEMVLIMDKLYDNWDFPQRTTSYRTFGKKNKMDDYHNPNSIRKRDPIRDVKVFRGKMATFLVQVRYRQYSSWQGQVLWAEGKKKIHFRSVLELMKLIDSVVTSDE